MDATASFRPPRRWLRLGKYLLPLGMSWPEGRWSRPPWRQVAIADLAAGYPQSVLLHTAGAAELLGDFSYTIHCDGRRETRVLPGKYVAAARVAEIRDGQSFGRHCCVIGPDGTAVRETGFHLQGAVLDAKKPVPRWRPRYWRKRWEGDVTSRPWLPGRQRLDGRVAVLNQRISHNYFHWLIEILPRLAALRRAGLSADYYLVDSLTPFQRDAFAALGIEPRQLIQPHCRLLLEAEQLLVPCYPTPQCLRDFRGIVTEARGAGRDLAARRIYISRRKTGTRTLANEEELEALLSRHGFETHAMEQYSLVQQAQLIQEARIVVATHGAGLANLLFARPGTRVVEIVPAGRFNATCYPNKSQIFGLHHQQVVAPRARHRQILRVGLRDVEAALERALASDRRSSAA